MDVSENRPRHLIANQITLIATPSRSTAANAFHSMLVVNAAPAQGLARVTFDATPGMATVTCTRSDLTAPTTASRITNA